MQKTGLQTSPFAFRISEEEKAQLDAAAVLEAQPGDRGGTTGWARRVLLCEAKRVLDKVKEPGQ